MSLNTFVLKKAIKERGHYPYPRFSWHTILLMLFSLQNILISGSTNNQIRYVGLSVELVVPNFVSLYTVLNFECLFRVWDLRNTQQPIHILNGHQYAVRRLKVSLHCDCVKSI